MKKELIICIIIVITIIIGNTVTQKYTEKAVEETSKNLEELKVELINNEESEEKEKLIKEKAKETNENWEGKYEKLAYFIEHDELEKINTNLTGMNSFIETKKYEEAINELDKTKFVLKHIEEKYALNFKNIF